MPRKKRQSSKTIKTTGRLHFTDLSHERFEDLCLAIIYRLNRWDEINHYGRSGKDDGIDIYASDILENGNKRTWHIQCKRYKSITKSQLKNVVDEIITNNKKPDILILMVACDLSKEKIELFKNYAEGNGIKKPLVWPSSIIEAKLYTEYHDLLFAYFGISLTFEKKSKISSIKRNIKMKHRMMKDFLTKSVSREEAFGKPWKRFISLELIIHSIDDNSYPEIDEISIGISPWFKVEVHDFYYNGLEVLLNIQYVIIDEEGNWDFLEYDEKYNENKYVKRKVFRNGRIPFENIIEYDLIGDEFYHCPHIYCDFKNNGVPYEDYAHIIIDDEYRRYLENNKRVKLKRY